VPVVSSPPVIDTCLDKPGTRDFLAALGLPVLPTYTPPCGALDGFRSGAVAFPLVVKRRSLLQSRADRVPAPGEAAPVTGSPRARPLVCSRFEQAFQTARGPVE
jgi:hypothetical protein